MRKRTHFRPTPGPWIIGCATGNFNIVSIDGIGIAKCGMHNARLISAVPDLLEALKNVISFYPYTHIDTDTPEGCAYHQAKLAIEKAEGG